jgi:hypothetical protein
MKDAGADHDAHGRRSPAADGGRPGIGHVSIVRPTVLGLVAGAGYAACLRVWMRLVSTEPEFSWGGTGYIVGVFAVLGAMAGLVSAGRRRGWGRMLVSTRAVGVVLSLGCFVAAGTLMVPTIVPAALGWSRSDWPRPLRAGLLLFGTAAAVAVVTTLPGLSLPRRLLALVIYLLLCPVEVVLTARLYAPSLPRGSLGRPGKVVPVAAGVALVAGLAVMLIGV